MKRLVATGRGARRAFPLHAYADRKGNVVPGVTLYDAWQSGRPMEMPDVESLGIVHDVLDDWKTWKSPVPSSKHKKLYAAIGELFEKAHRYRALREAVASCFLVGEPQVPDGYAGHVQRFHSLWERHASAPITLAKNLPDARTWERYLENWARVCLKNERLFQSGLARQDLLSQNGRVVRRTLVRVMDEFGALDRRRKPRRKH